MLEMTTD